MTSSSATCHGLAGAPWVGQARSEGSGRGHRHVVLHPWRSVSVAPEDGEKRLVELGLARSAVTRVDGVIVPRVPAGVGRDQVADDRASLRVGALVGGAAMERPAVV